MGHFEDSDVSVEITRWTPWKNCSVLFPDIQTLTIIPKKTIESDSQVFISYHHGSSVVFLKSLNDKEIGNDLNRDIRKAIKLGEAIWPAYENARYRRIYSCSGQ